MLASATEHSPGEAANLDYATVCPMVIITRIVIGQVVLILLA